MSSEFGHHNTEIAKYLKVDRTTINHHIDSVNNWLETDKLFKEKYNKVKMAIVP